MKGGIMNNKGFTLLELIVVLIVMAALVAIALPQYMGFVERAKAAEAITALGTIKVSEEAYRISTGSYTSTMSELGVTLATTTWTYGVVGTAGTSFVATASRVGGPEDTKTVTLTYTAAGASTWGGTHSGRPH